MLRKFGTLVLGWPKKYLIAAAIGVVAIVGVIFWGGGGQWVQQKITQSQPVPASKQSYPSIQVGKTSEAQLQQIVGQPQSSYQLDGWQVETAASTKSPYQPDRFYVKDGVVQMKEQWFEPETYFMAEADAMATYGTPGKVWYVQQNSPYPIKVSFFGGQGVAVYVFDGMGAVQRLQFFKPMSAKEYLANWGKNLGEKKPGAMTEKPGT